MPRTKKFDEQETLTKATELFWEKGYAATSMQELVDCMGINRASMYSTYGDKDQLFIDALAKYQEKNKAEMDALVAAPIPARDKLNKLFCTNLTQCDGSSKKGCFMVNTAIETNTLNPAAAQMVRDNLDFFTKAFTTIIEQGQQEGTVNKEVPAEHLAKFMLTTVNGMKVSSKLGYDQQYYQQVMDIVGKVLFV